MQEINALSFLGAATAMARMHQIFYGLPAAYSETLIPASVATLRPPVENFVAEAEKVGAKLAVKSANRLLARLAAEPCDLTVYLAVTAMQDIESRFADHVADVKMFAMSEHESVLMQPADELVELAGFSIRYPRTSYEVEEAAKCLALGRFNAAVFHAMRMLELGIKALAKRLDIPDPVKTSEKNWGVLLRTIIARIDELWPASKRLPSSEGAEFEALHATLDAIRNPWRNATMHVETIYAPHEAGHILRCTAFFMRRLNDLCDEDGNPAGPITTPALASSDIEMTATS